VVSNNFPLALNAANKNKIEFGISSCIAPEKDLFSACFD